MTRPSPDCPLSKLERERMFQAVCLIRSLNVSGIFRLWFIFAFDGHELQGRRSRFAFRGPRGDKRVRILSGTHLYDSPQGPRDFQRVFKSVFVFSFFLTPLFISLPGVSSEAVFTLSHFSFKLIHQHCMFSYFYRTLFNLCT